MQVCYDIFTWLLLAVVFLQHIADPPQASTALREESKTGNTAFALLFRKVSA